MVVEAESLHWLTLALASPQAQTIDNNKYNDNDSSSSASIFLSSESEAEDSDPGESDVETEVENKAVIGGRLEEESVVTSSEIVEDKPSGAVIVGGPIQR